MKNINKYSIFNNHTYINKMLRKLNIRLCMHCCNQSTCVSFIYAYNCTYLRECWIPEYNYNNSIFWGSIFAQLYTKYMLCDSIIVSFEMKSRCIDAPPSCSAPSVTAGCCDCSCIDQDHYMINTSSCAIVLCGRG